MLVYSLVCDEKKNNKKQKQLVIANGIANEKKIVIVSMHIKKLITNPIATSEL